jgi:pSer/pThr/pTyr-binding forkhead associated (FHA) protein
MSLQGAAFQQIARPTLGRLRFSDGRVIDLDRPQLIGRNPTIEGQIRGELPDIVKIDGAGQGLSRRHVSIRLEGWQVLLEDLNSANGTTITAPGRQPQRLHPGEPLVLEAGTSVDLGGEISFVLEVA